MKLIQQIQDDLSEELMPAFQAMAEQIDVYYKAVGRDEISCGVANYLWFDKDPGLSIDWVPPEARKGLATLIEGVGIKLNRGNGSGGEGAYCLLLAEGLTKDKLQALEKAVRDEIARLKGESFQSLATTESLAQDFERLAQGKSAGDALKLLASLFENINVFPDRTKDELTRKIAAMVKAVEPPTAGER